MIRKKEKPLVSIGIPTYNRADTFLRQALKSALSQTYPNIEVIVSDNCSTDNTEEVVKSFNDPRIRYFKQKVNIGSVPNANFCVQQAKGDYFLLHHDDDLIDPDFVETCMNVVNHSTDIGIIRTGTRVVDKDGNVIQESRNTAAGLSTTEFFRNWFAMKFSIYLCSTLFNARELKAVGGFQSIHYLFDDVVTIARLSKTQRVDIEDIKASFRKHGDEVTFSANIKDWCEDSLYLLDLICDVVDEESREITRKEGLRFLAHINYQFASAVKSWPRRQLSYLVVYKMFGFSHLPPNIRKLVYRNPVTVFLRAIKRYA
jgi:glycosyltransferase involved in cell wall biosynthesis